MANNTQNRLTRAVKRLLDVFRVLAIAGLILWPLAMVIMTIGQSSHSNSWGVDISVYSGFTIDLNKFETDITKPTGVREPTIKGKSELGIDTSSLKALYVFTLLVELAGIVGLYVLLQLRALFAKLVSGANFAPENAGRIRKTGIALISWSLASPILQYIGGFAILEEYALQVPGIELYPAFQINGMTIFIGAAMLILAEIISEASQIHTDQQLTI